MQRTMGLARGLILQAGRTLSGCISRIAGRSVPEPDAKRSNTFVIPAEFSSGSAVLSLGLAVTAVLACSLAGLGGYLASNSATPREHAVSPVMMMLAVTQPQSEPLPVQPRVDEAVTVTALPEELQRAPDVAVPIRSTPSGNAYQGRRAKAVMPSASQPMASRRLRFIATRR